MNVDVMCISEQRLSYNQVDIFLPIGFVVADEICRTQVKKWGTSVLVKNTMQCQKIDLSNYSSMKYVVLNLMI